MPKTRWAETVDGASIAYQDFGEGPVTLVVIHGWISHLEVYWEQPRFARFMRRLSRNMRVLQFDKRGVGMSDRFGRPPDLETRMDDVRAVMDAVGSESAFVFGISEGGPMSLLFAATYPQRAQAVVVYGSYAQPSHLVTDDEFNREIELIDRLWGTGEYMMAR